MSMGVMWSWLRVLRRRAVAISTAADELRPAPWGMSPFDEYVASGEVVALVLQCLGYAFGVVGPGLLLVVVDVV